MKRMNHTEAQRHGEKNSVGLVDSVREFPQHSSRVPIRMKPTHSHSNKTGRQPEVNHPPCA